MTLLLIASSEVGCNDAIYPFMREWVHAMAQLSYGRLDAVFVMRTVLTAWCSRHGFNPNSREAQSAALKILDLMQNRFLTRKDLLALLDQNPPSH